MNDKIPVYMSKEEAALFVLFMKHYDKIGYLIAEGVFDLKLGSATMHFGRDGQLNSLEKKEVKHPNRLQVFTVY